MTTETAVDASLIAAVQTYMATSGADFTSASAMVGNCQDYSIAVAAYLTGVELTDEDGDVVETADSWPVQKWLDKVPAALAGNDLAGGHYVAIVDWVDGYRYEIDLTAAQFAELGWTAPRIRFA